jgi:hypothetical protein
MAEEEKNESGALETIAPWGMGLILLAFLGYLAFTNVSIVASVLLLCIGIGGAVSLGLFGWGLILYLIRLGNEYRETGLHIMEWSVSVLFVVVACGALLRLVERLAS